MWEAAIETCLLRLLEERGPGATLCPSEVARALVGSENEAAWRALMPKVRQVATLMADGGRLSVFQGGREADIRDARGPIRLGLPPGNAGKR